MERTDLVSRLETALASPTPRARLQVLMGEMLENGLERDEIFPALQDFRTRLAQAGQASQAELIDEMLDGFNGWCVLY